MKLKKIASLALAGIMAVSMLTACGEGTNNSNSGSSSSQPTTASVVSTVKNAIADAISKIGQMQEPFAKTARDPQYDAINQAAISACNNVRDVLNEVLNKLTSH